MNTKQIVKSILPPFITGIISSLRREKAYKSYLSRGGVPYSTGYIIHKTNVISETLQNNELLDRFRKGELIPVGYGIGIDERCVEYPWIISQLEEKKEILLDAGSTLNFDFMLNLPILGNKEIHILTLAPENECFWERKVSYLFHDLRNLPIRDNYYDSISCISTLEHIGCNNSNFTGNTSDFENFPEDYLVATRELCRVLKPGGSLFITIPFGKYQHSGVQQQFDSKLLATLLEVLSEAGDVDKRFYLYKVNGWNIADEEDCAECQYVEWSIGAWSTGKLSRPIPKEPDFAVAARAVACIRLMKKVTI